jgi:hypothetical protein
MNLPSTRHSRRLGRTRVAFRATASRQLFAREAAEFILALFTDTRNRLLAMDAEAGLALRTREEGIFAIKAKILVAPFTAKRIYAIVTERLAAPPTDGHLITVVAESSLATIARVGIFALGAEHFFTLIATKKIFTIKTERVCTGENFIAVIAECHVAFCTGAHLTAVVT